MIGTRAPNTLFAFGVNHKTAQVEVREKLYLRDEEIPLFLSRIGSSLSECLLLSTCNRTEIYAVTDSKDVDLNYYKNLIIDFKGARGLVRDEHFFEMISCSAVRQLFSVATSLDSKVVGDLQILRQLRVAYSIARAEKMTGKILNRLLQRAFKLGKRVYSETSLHHGAVSASLAAVELGIEIFGSLRGRSVLVLGAGEIARLTAEILIKKRVGKILVSSRTLSHAESLVNSLRKEESVETELIDFGDFKGRLDDVDMVITSTGSDEPILYKRDFAALDRKLLIIDIAVPRDVETAAAENPNVILRNIDDLHSIVDENHKKRLRDIPKVRRMIMNEMVEFLTDYYTLPLMPAYEKTAKPSADQTSEILRTKEFLNRNVSEIHKLFSRSSDSFREDLKSHFALVEKLQTMKAEAFGETAS